MFPNTRWGHFQHNSLKLRFAGWNHGPPPLGKRLPKYKIRLGIVKQNQIILSRFCAKSVATIDAPVPLASCASTSSKPENHVKSFV
jgi:hypothetical protein